MNLLVEKIKSATGGRAEDYASKHERTSEELQFVNEMIHNIGIEIETYQEEYAKMEPEGYRELVVGKILRRKSDENLKRIIESLQSQLRHLEADKNKLEASIYKLDQKLQRTKSEFSMKDFSTLFGSIATKGPDQVSEESSFRVFTGSLIDAGDIKPGMHLYRKRTGYSHHGICVKGKRGVYIIHFNGDLRTGGAWAKAKLLKMVKGNIQQNGLLHNSPIQNFITATSPPPAPYSYGPDYNNNNNTNNVTPTNNIPQQATQYPEIKQSSPLPPQSYISPSATNHLSPPQYYAPQFPPHSPHSPDPSSRPHEHIQHFQTYIQNQVQNHLPHHHNNNNNNNRPPLYTTFPQNNYHHTNLQQFAYQPNNAQPPNTNYQVPIYPHYPQPTLQQPQPDYQNQQQPYYGSYPPQPANLQQQQQQQVHFVPPPNVQQQQQQVKLQAPPNLQHPDVPADYVQSLYPDVSKGVVPSENISSITDLVDPKARFNSGDSIGYVMESSIEEFVAGEPVYVANYKYHASDDVIQARAKRVLLQGGYSVVARNCEHLATWCVTGVGKSLQVQEKLVQKMAKVAEVVEKATASDPNVPKENLTRVIAAVPLPVLQMVLDFSSKQVDKFGKNVQFLMTLATI